jgi:hypothetical protein
MRGFHELLWYIHQALEVPAAGRLRPDLDRAIDDTRSIARQSPNVLLGYELAAHRDSVNALLLRASKLARTDAGRAGRGRLPGSRPRGWTCAAPTSSAPT